jgi:hypothetical protein
MNSIEQEKFVLIIIRFYFLLSLYFRKQLILQDERIVDNISTDIDFDSKVKPVEEDIVMIQIYQLKKLKEQDS